VQGKDEVQARMLREQISYFQAALKDTRDRLDALNVTSPGTGAFLAQLPQDLAGRYMKRGDLLGYVVAENAATIRVVVPQSDIDVVRQETGGIDLRFASDPFTARHVNAVDREVPVATRTLPSAALSVPGGGPISVDPSDSKKLQALEMVFEVDLPLPEGMKLDRLGERVAVRFDHGSRTIAWQLTRKIRQLFLERFEL
jgi:putative peptide zinc metalloprotease protein